MARRAGAPVNVAVASNPDAAFHAARGFSGISIVPQGDEAKFLASLPVALLAPPEEIAETLARWGIRTFRDLAVLPDLGVAARLGEEGVRLQQLARGEGDRPLEPVEATQRFEKQMELEYPLELLEPLMFVLGRLLGDVCARSGGTGAWRPSGCGCDCNSKMRASTSARFACRCPCAARACS